LLREISVRNKGEGQVKTNSLPPSINGLKQIGSKGKVKERGLAHDRSNGQLNISPNDRRGNPDAIVSQSTPNQANMQSYRQPGANVYKSYNNSPSVVSGQSYRESITNLQRKPRVNYPGNMAYINISSDGQRLVGPLGLKKAEQELIKRRYKYPHY